jgi:hypothetical protein
VIADAVSPVNGAFMATNKFGDVVAGRACSRQSAIASPTSAGSGSMSVRPPLPAMVSSPDRQPTLAKRSRATSPPRSASRVMAKTIA